MTITSPIAPPVGTAPVAVPTAGGPQTSPAPVGAPAPAAPAESRGKAGLVMAGASLCILAAVLLGFVAELTVVGDLRHARDQKTAYADFRYDLAQGVAPVGQTDASGQLLAMGTPIGVLDVPALGLRQTVLEGTTSGVLVSGPGRLRSSVFPGQDGTAVIMGRRAAFGGPFADLATLKPGDPITVTTGQGAALYRVTGLRRAGDPVPAAPAATEGRLVLVTAGGAPYVPNGIVQVDAKRESAAAAATPRKPLATGIAGGETALASDTSAWVRLAFWAQGLLLAALVLTITSRRWGRWQTWIVGVPVLLFLGTAVAGQAALLLPNLM